MFQSALYHGTVFHKRLQPFIHQFTYKVFYLWLNLDELPMLAKNLKWFGLNKFNLFSFYNRDHGARDGSALRPWVEAALQQHGFADCVGGRIMLLCYPRILGYVFNPLAVYFCYNQGGELRAILHQVKNTFGEQHGYILPVKRNAQNLIVQNCQKLFFVSPFIQMQARYDFTVREPDEKMLVHIHQATHTPQAKGDTQGDMLLATLQGQRQLLNGHNLLACFWRYPLMTLKVMAAIHYEALILWRKGATYYRRGAPPAISVSNGQSINST